MIKPTVFFSHSSKDKLFITELKKIIIDRTSDTISIFQSSDGESIPFGRNWIHKIEENLKEAKIMFVFISPNSLMSNWIYFESGFSYSKGIKVIPVGILGIDIGTIDPPMSLLQGFNLYNNEGLNNIIAILNLEFSYQYKTNITESEYDVINQNNEYQKQSEHKWINDIKFIETYIPTSLKDNVVRQNAYTLFTNYLKEQSIKHMAIGRNQAISLYGMEVITQRDDNEQKDKLTFIADFIRLEENINIITGFLPVIYEKKNDKYWVFIYFNSNIELLTANYKLSGRLNEFGIEMSDINGSLYKYENLLFALDDKGSFSPTNHSQEKLRIVFNPDVNPVNEICGLIDFLFCKGIIKNVLTKT